MAQHMTTARMQVASGKMDDLIQLMDEEDAEARRLREQGWQSTVVGKSKNDPNEVWVTVTWDNSQNYMKNSNTPEQNAWYQKLRALLASDPEWHDCDVINEQRA